jgi:hypothetical protein
MKGDSATSRATVTPAGFVESEIASVIEHELYDTASRFQRGAEPQKVLADNGLHKFFSSAASRLCPSEPPIRDAAIAPLHGRSSHVSVLDSSCLSLPTSSKRWHVASRHTHQPDSHVVHPVRRILCPPSRLASNCCYLFAASNGCSFV